MTTIRSNSKAVQIGGSRGNKIFCESVTFLSIWAVSFASRGSAAFCHLKCSGFLQSHQYSKISICSRVLSSKCMMPGKSYFQRVKTRISASGDIQPIHVPLEEDLLSEILSIISESPQFGFRRVHQAVKTRRPEWAVRDTRVRAMLQRLRTQSQPMVTNTPMQPETAIDGSAAERLEALYTQSLPPPSSDFDVVADDNKTEEFAQSATTATDPSPMMEGLRAPPRRDELIDAARAYGDRFSELLELERSHQASEVLERLRAWPTARLQREGLAVTGLVANPGGARRRFSRVSSHTFQDSRDSSTTPVHPRSERSRAQAESSSEIRS